MTDERNNASDHRMDEAIHRALRSGAGEPPFLTQVGEAMSGRSWWLNLLALPMMLGMFAVAVVAVVRFFGATETRGMILWATIFLFCMLSVGMLKMWYWMVINRNAVTREVKRLEYQVARLAEGRART